MDWGAATPGLLRREFFPAGIPQLVPACQGLAFSGVFSHLPEIPESRFRMPSLPLPSVSDRLAGVFFARPMPPTDIPICTIFGISAVPTWQPTRRDAPANLW